MKDPKLWKIADEALERYEKALQGAKKPKPNAKSEYREKQTQHFNAVKLDGLSTTEKLYYERPILGFVPTDGQANMSNPGKFQTR